jgi:UTP--glucose-1-phosphate uridylyltransferase
MPHSIDAQLAQLPSEVHARLAQHRFDAERFKRLAARLGTEQPQDNFVKGTIRAPEPTDIVNMPEPGSSEYLRFEAAGAALLAAGQVALVVLAGGMATRMGGVVKALVEALPGKTFLDLRLAEIEAIRRRFGQAPAFWMMTSQATDRGIREALGPKLDGSQIAVFSQHLSLRLTPTGSVFVDAAGNPSEHAPGHGDLPDALRESGLLPAFVKRGGKLLMITNLDNLGGTLDPAIIGFHLAHGRPVTSEVVDKLDADRGGIPVYVDDKLCVLEEFRIPPSFDPQIVRVFNTNVFWCNAQALLELEIPWTFFTVKKSVNGQPVIQFERLVNEITSYLPTRYLHLPREGDRSRFLPVKDDAELERRRPEILAVARARGLAQ